MRSSVWSILYFVPKKDPCQIFLSDYILEFVIKFAQFSTLSSFNGLMFLIQNVIRIICKLAKPYRYLQPTPVTIAGENVMPIGSLTNIVNIDNKTKWNNYNQPWCTIGYVFIGLQEKEEKKRGTSYSLVITLTRSCQHMPGFWYKYVSSNRIE